MEKKVKNTTRVTRKDKKETYYVVCLPEYEKDLSHMMTPENARPEIGELIRKMAGSKLTDYTPKKKK
jgi:predicted RNase H-like HicB family nuclease